MQASLKQELNPLFNLIYAIKLACKKKDITEGEVDYFFKQLFLLKDFEKWRNILYFVRTSMTFILSE